MILAHRRGLVDGKRLHHPFHQFGLPTNLAGEGPGCSRSGHRKFSIEGK
jgi:hypothetical protein